MATIKQKKALENLVGNHGNVTRAMLDAGYSPNTANTPSQLTESVGFKELCDKYGLTDKLILNALVEDIKLKPQNRKPELELGAKMLNRLIERKDIMSGGKIIPLTNVFVQSSSSDSEDSTTQEES